MLDEFVNGNVTRISPDAPVPVHLSTETSWRASGAAIAATTVVQLISRATVVGVVGPDSAGRRISDLLQAHHVIADLVVDDSRPTTIKRRIMAQNHHLLRLDTEDAREVDRETSHRLIERIEQHARESDAMLISDYVKGACSNHVVTAALAVANTCGIPTVVDTKRRDLDVYKGVAAITPNEAELANMLLNHTSGSQEQRISALRHHYSFKSLLLTRSEAGAEWHHDQGIDYAAATNNHPRDVAGAGDAMAATLSVCLAAQVPRSEALVLASTVSGVAIGRRLDKRVTRRDLLPLQEPASSTLVAGQGETQ